MAISITKALNIIYKEVGKLSSEVIPIEDSLGRIVSREYSSTFDLPRFDNSAMDGYAIKMADSGRVVSSSRVIYAGDDSNFRLQEGEAIRIMTGSAVPDGTEAIVPIENVEVDGDRVSLPKDIKLNAHIRYAGEDMKSSTRYIKSGDMVSAYTTALFASQGVTHIDVTRAVRVAVFGTGDELRPHYEKIEPHQLYNSNAPMFLARAEELNCEVTYIDGSADTIESLKLSIQEALSADLIITSGGVSVGDKDFTKEAFQELGMETFFSGVDIKPGKPTTIGRIKNSIVVNLAGNPLASMVNYEMFIKPIILRLSGNSRYYHGLIRTKISKDYRIKAGRYSVILGSFNGESFTPLDNQSAGMVSPLVEADGMIIVTPDISYLNSGDEVKMIPIKFGFNSDIEQDIFTIKAEEDR